MKKFNEIVTRKSCLDPVESLKKIYSSISLDSNHCDAIYKDSTFQNVIGVSGLPFKAPAILELLKDDVILEFIFKYVIEQSLLILFDKKSIIIKIAKNEEISDVPVPDRVASRIDAILSDVAIWSGIVNESGEHVVDLQTPAPGPHFNVNLLLGNRVDFERSLQTTPKSVVNRYGQGSFRSHAAVQVLATRWDMLPEENGFPANRQFYLVENGKQIFYSADVNNDNIESGYCIHSQNNTKIIYKTKCGLEIERYIFILPQEKNLPLATESHRITIRNTAKRDRKLKIVYTGMFGAGTPHALQEDIIYSTVIMQSKILNDEFGNIIAVGNDYYPDECRSDLRFHTMMAHTDNGLVFPTEFCFKYDELVGAGTIDRPENLALLSNKLNRKGPGFFAVGLKFNLATNHEVVIDNFTGLVSDRSNPGFNEDTYKQEINALIDSHKDIKQTERELNDVISFLHNYSSYIQVKTGDNNFDIYFNNNLPFQVLYQTYVSRSFAQTQKGYREIGFREIQDIFASMYYFVSMGKAKTVKDLIKQWIENIFEFGYGYHNFFWSGKEPGKWSDDTLWLLQAVYRYVVLTGDLGFLDEEFVVAGTNSIKTRSLIETIDAIITYCGKISIGKHNLPLLDFADWNDCLQIDNDFIDGVTKEKLYKEQIARGGTFGDPFESDYSESVMNAFLLKVAIDHTAEMCEMKGDRQRFDKYKTMSAQLCDDIHQHAWKGDFYARVLLNRYKDGSYTYLGAGGDGLSGNPDNPGTYFLNAFSWSVLSGCATDEQLKVMYESIEKYIKTPYGLRLMTSANLEKLATGTAAGHYFPGDRENSAVFKHASMMGAAALLNGAKQVTDKRLATKMTDLAYWMIDLVLPYNTMKNPYQLCGNPRICTQYINSDTGENIGPLLSGTSTWLLLCLFTTIGINYSSSGIVLDPLLRNDQDNIEVNLNTGQSQYIISIQKPKGFFRTKDSDYTIELDGKKMDHNIVPIFTDKKHHSITMKFV